jgi:hypothetical protein
LSPKNPTTNLDFIAERMLQRIKSVSQLLVCNDQITMEFLGQKDVNANDKINQLFISDQLKSKMTN